MSAAGRPTLATFDHHRGVMPLLRQTSTLRGVFFVGANLAGAVVANAFLHYLQTGRWLDFTLSAYRKSLAVSLSDMLVRPPSIFSHPWMIVVAGLLMAAVVFVPVMLAVLYRLWVSVLFVLAVALFAHSPVLAACLAVGCVIAGRTRLRSNLPFLALLMGVLSASALYVVLYYFFFARGFEPALLPLQRPVFCLPFVVALVSVVLAGASVLWLARATRFRPGVIWPALLVLLAAPLGVFYTKVGPAELDYGLLARPIERGDGLFPARGVGESRRARPSAPRLGPGQAELLAAARADLDRRRQDLSARCKRFLRRYDDSGRGAAVMYVLNTLRDVRVDAEAFERGVLRYEYAGPSDESVGAWRDLAEKFPDSPQAGVARFRMAVVAVRDGRVEMAWRLVDAARFRLASYLQPIDLRPPPGPWERVFIPLVSLPGVEYYRAASAEIDRVIWLISANKVREGTPENLQAFAEYMKLWPFGDASGQRLGDLAADYEKTEIADNFRLRAAMVEPDLLKRTEDLAALAGGVSDSAITANYELGRLVMLRGPINPNLKTAQEYFKVVISAPPSPYRAAAEQHLAALASKKKAAP